jgi:hypothetical protein
LSLKRSLDQAIYGLHAYSVTTDTQAAEFNSLTRYNSIDVLPKFLLKKIKHLGLYDSDQIKKQLSTEWINILGNILNIHGNVSCLTILRVDNVTDLYSKPEILQKISQIEKLQILVITLMEGKSLTLPPNLTGVEFTGNEKHPAITENQITNWPSTLESVLFHKCFVHCSIVEKIPQLKRLYMISSYFYDEFDDQLQVYRQTKPITLMPSLETFFYADKTFPLHDGYFLTYNQNRRIHYIEPIFISNIARHTQLKTLITDFCKNGVVIPLLPNLTRLDVRNTSKDIYNTSDVVWNLPSLTSITATNFRITNENLEGCVTLKNLEMVKVPIDWLHNLKIFSKITTFKLIDPIGFENECPHKEFFCKLLKLSNLKIITLNIDKIQELFTYLSEVLSIDDEESDSAKIIPLCNVKRYLYVQYADIYDKDFLAVSVLLKKLDISMIATL